MSHDALDQRTTEYIEWKHALIDDLDPLTIMLLKEEIDEYLELENELPNE